jgi:hypothetical protein
VGYPPQPAVQVEGAAAREKVGGVFWSGPTTEERAKQSRQRELA